MKTLLRGKATVSGVRPAIVARMVALASRDRAFMACVKAAIAAKSVDRKQSSPAAVARVTSVPSEDDIVVPHDAFLEPGEAEDIDRMVAEAQLETKEPAVSEMMVGDLITLLVLIKN